MRGLPGRSTVATDTCGQAIDTEAVRDRITRPEPKLEQYLRQ